MLAATYLVCAINYWEILHVKNISCEIFCIKIFCSNSPVVNIFNVVLKYKEHGHSMHKVKIKTLKNDSVIENQLYSRLPCIQRHMGHNHWRSASV